MIFNLLSFFLQKQKGSLQTQIDSGFFCATENSTMLVEIHLCLQASKKAAILTGSPHAQTPLIVLRSHFLIPTLLYILKGICYAYCLREFSINSPVLSCLFLSSLKRTPDTRSLPHPPPRSDGWSLCLSSRFFPPPGSPLPISYLNLGRLGVGAPGENLLLLFLNLIFMFLKFLNRRNKL